MGDETLGSFGSVTVKRRCLGAADEARLRELARSRSCWSARASRRWFTSLGKGTLDPSSSDCCTSSDPSLPFPSGPSFRASPSTLLSEPCSPSPSFHRFFSFAPSTRVAFTNSGSFFLRRTFASLMPDSQSLLRMASVTSPSAVSIANAHALSTSDSCARAESKNLRRCSLLSTVSSLDGEWGTLGSGLALEAIVLAGQVRQRLSNKGRNSGGSHASASLRSVACVKTKGVGAACQLSTSTTSTARCVPFRPKFRATRPVSPRETHATASRSGARHFGRPPRHRWFLHYQIDTSTLSFVILTQDKSKQSAAQISDNNRSLVLGSRGPRISSLSDLRTYSTVFVHVLCPVTRKYSPRTTLEQLQQTLSLQSRCVSPFTSFTSFTCISFGRLQF
jgi:hypothetical protein